MVHDSGACVQVCVVQDLVCVGVCHCMCGAAHAHELLVQVYADVRAHGEREFVEEGVLLPHARRRLMPPPPAPT